MRRVLLDEGVPTGVRSLVGRFSVDAAAEFGWAELTSGNLAASAEHAGCEATIGADRNIGYRQNMASRQLALIVLTTNHRDTIRDHGEGILPAVDAASAGSYATIDFRRRRRGPWRPSSA